MKKIRVLFVCMGNICRSPTAHSVFEQLVRDAGLEANVEVDSAGTHAYHVGEPPDRRAQQTARGRGIDLSGQRARKVHDADFHEFDYILAMDEDNLHGLRSRCPPECEDRLHLFLSFAPRMGEREVPDPYYGGTHGFEHVFDLVDAAGRGLLEDIRARLPRGDG